MRCPVCQTDLVPYSYGGQTIDTCPGCQGIWFDPGELGIAAREMVTKGAIPDQDARDAYCSKRDVSDRGESEKLCPRCMVPTTVFNYSYDSNVFLNKCPTCNGVWADAGELGQIAKYIKGNPAVNRYAESLGKELAHEGKHGVISRLLRSRLLSGLVALLYLGGALITGDPDIIVKMTLFLIFPLACIWFSDAMGAYTGLNFSTRPAITGRTPGVFVAFGGWLVLLGPLVLGIILACE